MHTSHPRLVPNQLRETSTTIHHFLPLGFGDAKMEPLNFKSDGISIDNTRSKIVHAWRVIENYVRYMTGDETFDIATAWNEEEHGDRIDILNAFKRRISPPS